MADIMPGRRRYADTVSEPVSARGGHARKRAAVTLARAIRRWEVSCSRANARRSS